MRKPLNRAVVVLGLLAVVSAGCAGPHPTPQSASLPSVPAAAPPASRPDLLVTFEPNVGQTDPAVRFVSRGSGYALFLTPDEAVMTVGADVRMRFEGASPEPALSGIDALPGAGNHLTGSDTSRWRTGVPQFAKVSYQGVYPGIDLVFYGGGKQLEYDFLVAPGADPSVIRLAFEGATVTLDPSGDLVLDAAGDRVVQHKPKLFQGEDIVDGRFVRTDVGTIAFAVGPYDRDRPLVIDPVIEWSTYLAGSSGADGYDVDLDAAGNVYVTGVTSSLDFPTRNALQPVNRGNGDTFVTKIDPSGSTIIYSTYLGGANSDLAREVVVDGSGNATIVGFTTSLDFPLVRPLQATPGGSFDAFASRLDASGSTLLFSTYLGGSGYDAVEGGEVDAAGNIYIVGHTTATDFPTTPGALQPALAGSKDAFIAKVNPVTPALVYATYLGGSGFDEALAVAVDPAGNAYVAGNTRGLSQSLPGAFQPAQAGNGDAFVARINPAGTALVGGTYLGGAGYDNARGVALDGAGNVYLAGESNSFDFPLVRALQGRRGTFTFDAFVAKFAPGPSSVVYSTLLGGTEQDAAFDVASDASGRAYVTGYTYSTDFPTAAAPQPAYAGAHRPLPPHDFPIEGDAFVTAIEASGAGLVYSTYLGGSLADLGVGIAVTGAGAAAVAGRTGSSDFPTVRPLLPDAQHGAFVTKLSAPTSPAAMVAGSTWLSNGTTSGSGPAGSAVRVYATTAFTNVGYRLVTARPDPDNPDKRCAVDPVPVNDTVRFANANGFITTTVGTVNRPPGEWDLCFRSLTGETVTAPIRFTVTGGA